MIIIKIYNRVERYRGSSKKYTKVGICRKVGICKRRNWWKNIRMQVWTIKANLEGAIIVLIWV